MEPENDFDEDLDIIEEVTIDNHQREAYGIVRNQTVRIVKEESHLPEWVDIIARCNGKTKTYTFDTESRADEYFDKLVEKYDLAE